MKRNKIETAFFNATTEMSVEDLIGLINAYSTFVAYINNHFRFGADTTIPNIATFYSYFYDGSIPEHKLTEYFDAHSTGFDIVFNNNEGDIREHLELNLKS